MRPAAAPRHLRAPEFLSRLPRPSLKLALIAAAAAVALTAGWLWLRDSSLVRVNRVVVQGAHGFGSPGVRSALDAAGRDMTTLHIDEGALRSAVSRYPLVRDIRVHRDLPHTLRIHVLQRTVVGVISAGGAGGVAVANDGTFLRGVPVSSLPVIVSKLPPGGSHARDAKTRAKVDLLAAAPPEMRRQVARVTLGASGLTAWLRNGMALRFGGADRLEAKWIAVRRVLHDPVARQARYLDVRIPERPAAGGLTEMQGGAPQSAVASRVDPNAIAAEDPGAPQPPPDTAAAQAAEPAPADPALTEPTTP